MKIIEKPKTAKGLAKLVFTKQRIEYMDWVEKRDGGYYVDNDGVKEIVLTDDAEGIERILKQCYQQCPPNTGYLKFYSFVSQRYVGVRRQVLLEFLQRQEPKMEHARLLGRSQTGVTRTHSVGANFVTDVKYMVDVRYKNKQYIGTLSIIDTFSKMLFSYPISTTSTAESIRVFKQWFEDLGDYKGRVKTIKSDRGSEYSQQFTDFLTEHNIKHILGKAHNPTGQGLVEKSHVTLGGMSCSWAKSQYGDIKYWIKTLPQLVGIDGYINNTYSRILKNRTARDVWEGKGTQETRERLNDIADSRRNTQVYIKHALSVGDRVLLSLRVVGDSETKAAYKSKMRKNSMLANWDVSKIYTVRQKRGHSYLLHDFDGYVDRNDCLLVKSGGLDKYIPAEEPQQDEAVEETKEEEVVRSVPKRARREMADHLTPGVRELVPIGPKRQRKRNSLLVDM